MIVIINGLVIFNSDDSTLSLADQLEIYVKLQPISSLVLSELLLKNNSSISREELLESVWVGRGYTPSNASLNNSIAAIRKNYYTLTNTELHLKTLPKVGYEFKCDIKIVEAADNNENVDSKIPIQSNKVFKERKSNLIYWAALIIIIISMVVIFKSVFDEKSLKVNNKSFIKIDTVGRCNIYSYNSSSISGVYEKTVKNKVNLDECTDTIPSGIDIFIDLNTQGDKYIFYTLCTKENNETYEQCVNYKTTNITRQ